MSTPFTDVYEFFLPKVSEYSFLTLSQIDLEAQLKNYLRSAIVDFVNPKVDLAKNDASSIFINDLNDDEKEVLATWMLYHFIRPKVISSQNYKQMMSDSDFKFYSQANHLQALSLLMKAIKREAEMLNTKYSYKDRDLSSIASTNTTTDSSANGVLPFYDWYLYYGGY